MEEEPTFTYEGNWGDGWRRIDHGLTAAQVRAIKEDRLNWRRKTSAQRARLPSRVRFKEEGK